MKWTRHTVWVQLDNGQCLGVDSSTVGQPDMIRIADTLQLASADVGWIGTG